MDTKMSPQEEVLVMNRASYLSGAIAVVYGAFILSAMQVHAQGVEEPVNSRPSATGKKMLGGPGSKRMFNPQPEPPKKKNLGTNVPVAPAIR
jgi:hypothetical protein